MSVTFTRSNPGIHDPATDTFSGASVETWTGEGVAFALEGRRYKELELVEKEALSMYFAPTTYAAVDTEPPLGATIAWPEGTTNVFRIVRKLAVNPDGLGLIMAELIIAR